MHIVHKLFPNKFPIKKKNLRRNLRISYELLTRKIREGLVDHPYILAINLAIRRNIFFLSNNVAKYLFVFSAGQIRGISSIIALPTLQNKEWKITNNKFSRFFIFI